MQELLGQKALPAVSAVVGNGGKGLPPHISRMAPVEDDCVVIPDARDAAALRQNVP